MIVRVMRKHIKAGKRRSPSFCPVALALRDAGFTKVSVDCTIEVKQLQYVQVTPKTVLAFIRNFDTGRLVKPFSFRLPKSKEL
jgi:hypothetical protein